MSYEAVGKLVDLWMSDPSFRAQAKKDPRTAARKAGVELSAEELATLNSVDWNLPDEQLQTRITKVVPNL